MTLTTAPKMTIQLKKTKKAASAAKDVKKPGIQAKEDLEEDVFDLGDGQEIGKIVD